MDVSRTDIDNKAFFTVKGRLDTSTVDKFREVANAVPIPEGDIMIDARELKYISSAGLREFLTLSKIAKKNGAEVRLDNVSPGVMEILEVTGFDALLTINSTSNA